MARVAGRERLPVLGVGDLPHQPHARRQLVVEPRAAHLHRLRAVQLHVERRVRRVPDARLRLALVVEVREEVQPVPADRAAERERELLVVDRHDPAEHRVRRVEAGVAEVAAHRSRVPVRPRPGDRDHLHRRRAAHRRVEAVRDVLKLADRLLAVTRLVAEPHLGGHLLAVEAELVLAHVARRAAVGDRRVRRVRRHAAARRQHRERHPVAPLHRQLLHLLRIDVAAELRRRDVDERRFAADRHRFGHAARRHLEVDDERLPDEQLDAGALRGGEPLQLRGNLVGADPRGNAVDAALVGCTAVTVTPGRTAPVESVMVPVRTASCANAAAGRARVRAARSTRRASPVIVPPCGFACPALPIWLP